MAWKKGHQNDKFDLRKTMEEYLAEVRKTLGTEEPDPYFYLKEFKDWAAKKEVEFFPGEATSTLTSLIREGKVAVVEGSEGIMFMITGH